MPSIPSIASINRFLNQNAIFKKYSLIDPDIAEFSAITGATDLDGLIDLVSYVKSENLWDYFRIYPMKSAQNAGSGLTVYGLGSLTANNITLVNSPTWGASGIAFRGMSAYASGNLTGLQTMSELYYFDRQIPDNASAPDNGNHINFTASDGNSLDWFGFAAKTGVLSNETMCVGITKAGSNGRVGADFSTAALEDSTFVFRASNSVAGTQIWKSKVEESAYVTSGPVTNFSPANANLASGSFLLRADNFTGPINVFTDISGVIVAQCFIGSPLTTTQRETITDLINAL